MWQMKNAAAAAAEWNVIERRSKSDKSEECKFAALSFNLIASTRHEALQRSSTDDQQIA